MMSLRLLSIVLIAFLVRFVRMQGGIEYYKQHHLIQAGEWNFGCTGRDVELKWKYRHLEDHKTTTWSKKKSDGTKATLASWSNGAFARDDQGANTVGLGEGKLSSNGCCGLLIHNVAMGDAGLYSIEVTTTDETEGAKVKTGVTNLHVYDDCPEVSNPTLKIECEVEGGSPKTDEFTYRDIVSVSIDIPSGATVLRRFYYQEQQHKIVQQPIRARCYNRPDCDVVQWTLAKKSLALAFFTRTPYLNMTLYARIYHKRVLLDTKSLVFRLVDPDSAEGKATARCKNQEPLPSGIGWTPPTWNVLLLISLTFAVSNSIHRII